MGHVFDLLLGEESELHACDLFYDGLGRHFIRTGLAKVIFILLLLRLRVWGTIIVELQVGINPLFAETTKNNYTPYKPTR
jgi:hypothetical protein